MPLILPPLDFTEIYCYCYGYCRLLTNGREYSIWNAAIASLQFWMEDLDPVTLGRATEHVYTTFFYSSTSYALCHQPDETLFGCFIIALNAVLTSNCCLLMKVMRVAQILLTYPLHYERLLTFTTFPA